MTQGDILLLARTLAEARGVKAPARTSVGDGGARLGHPRHESDAVRPAGEGKQLHEGAPGGTPRSGSASTGPRNVEWPPGVPRHRSP
jgi:hypothetical protein